CYPTRSSGFARSSTASDSSRAVTSPRPQATLTPAENVPLGPYCTLGVGGPARYFIEVRDEAGLLDARAWARRRGLPFRVLGGGSNLVVADEGVRSERASCRERVEVRAERTAMRDGEE